jgi:hypothetical protein
MRTRVHRLSAWAGGLALGEAPRHDIQAELARHLAAHPAGKFRVPDRLLAALKLPRICGVETLQVAVIRSDSASKST